MTRRAFLTRLTTGAIGAAAVLHLPASVLRLAPPDILRDGALEHLRRAYVAFQTRTGRPPAHIDVGQALYDAYEGELTSARRFVSTDSYRALAFKGARVVATQPGWAIARVA